VQRVSVKHKFNTANQDSLNEQFLEAVRQDNVERALQYLANGANINARFPNGDTALLQAARHGQTQVALMLVAKKASLDAQGNDGATALILAAKRGDIPLSRAFIDAGVDITIEDRDGRKALDHAMRTALPELVELFEKPLKKILDRIPSSDLAQALRNSNVNLDHMDPATGNTMLTWAAGQKDQESLAMAFIEAGANLQKTNSAGKTPLDVARESGNAGMQKILETAQRQKAPAPAPKTGEQKPLFSVTSRT
jgi:ankyrin repeat protein